jgi:hypothetical protein
VATVRKTLIFAAVAEVATGAALLVLPSLVGRLLLGQELAGISVVVARVLGFGLIGLGIACWPGPPRLGMLVYSTAVGLYLAYAGLALHFAGILLWPVVALHLTLTILLAWRRSDV